MVGRGPADAPSVISATPSRFSGGSRPPARADRPLRNGEGRRVTVPLLEECELAEELASRAQSDDDLVALVVEEHELHESAEHDERIASRIATVIDDLAGPEAAQVHLAREGVALRLGEDLDRQHVAERAGHRTKLVQIHRY